MTVVAWAKGSCSCSWTSVSSAGTVSALARSRVAVMPSERETESIAATAPRGATAHADASDDRARRARFTVAPGPRRKSGATVRRTIAEIGGALTWSTGAPSSSRLRHRHLDCSARAAIASA